MSNRSSLAAGSLLLPIVLLIGGCSGQGVTAPASIQGETVDRQAEGIGRDWFRDLTSADYDTVIKDSRGMYVVLFRNDNCRPCDDMSRSISTIEKAPPASVGVVNIDNDFELARQMNIRGVPTTVIYQDGSQVARNDGSMTSRKFVEWIERYWIG